MSKALIKKAEQLIENFKAVRGYPEAPLNMAHEFITRYRSAVDFSQPGEEPETYEEREFGMAIATMRQLYHEYPFSKDASDDYKLKWFIDNIDHIDDQNLVEELEQCEEIGKEEMEKILNWFKRDNHPFRTSLYQIHMKIAREEIVEGVKRGDLQVSDYSNANYKYSYPKVKEYMNNQ